MAILGIVATSLEIISKMMDLLPDYEQKKREKFYDLRMELMEELNKPYEDRDDAKVVYVSKQLAIYMEAFSQELNNVEKKL